jgi:hypothetical protein
MSDYTDVSNPAAMIDQSTDAWGDLDIDSDFDSVSEVSNESSSEGDSSSNSETESANFEQINQDSSEGDQQDPSEGAEDQEAASGDSEEIIEVEIPPELAEVGIDIQDGVVGKYVKINGEDHFVELSELGNDYSGQKEIQRRFSEYDRQNKEWKQQVDEVNGYINEFAVKMQDPKQGPEAAMSYLGELGGIPPYEVKEQLIKALAPEIERRSMLSEAELRAEQVEAENKYLKENAERISKLRDSEQANKEFQQQSAQIRQEFSISDQEWNEAIEFLQKHPQVSEDNLRSPEFVSNFVRYERAENLVAEITPQVDASLLSNDNFYKAAMDEIFNNPDYTPDDVKEIIEGAYELARKEAVSKKIVKKAANRAESINNNDQNSLNAKPLDVLDWDDL